MYPDSFEYVAPDTVEAAVDYLAEADREGQNAQVLAGGHSLVPELKEGKKNPDILVDIGRIEDLRGVTADGSRVNVGAATPYFEAHRSEKVTTELPPLADALRVLGDRQVRNRGTVGGNLAQAEVGTDLPAPTLVLEGRLLVRGPDKKEPVPLESFYDDGSSLDSDEILTGVEMSPMDSGSGMFGSYVKRPHPHTGYPLIGVATVLEFDSETVTDAKVAATGATTSAPAVRLRATEEAITDVVLDSASGTVITDAAADASVDAAVDEFSDDAVVSPEYREHLLELYTERAIAKAVERKRRLDASEVNA